VAIVCGLRRLNGALGKPNFVTGLLATGRVRLYEHGVAVASAITGSPRSHPYSILNAIEAEFTGTGPGEAEVGLVGPNYFTLPASGYPQYFQYQFVNSGLNPNAANVDVPSEPPSAIRFTPANIRAWTAWVRAGKSAGIRSMAPIVAPNAAWERGNPIFPPTRGAYYDVNSSFYRLSRFEALSGGAIAFDSPPKFFLSGGRIAMRFRVNGRLTTTKTPIPTTQAPWGPILRSIHLRTLRCG
jgi:hypothetical protein